MPADYQVLLELLLPFAEQQIAAYGEFYPYAGAISKEGAPSAIAVHMDTDHPSSAEVLEGLREALLTGANAGEYRATALVYIVRVGRPPMAEPTEAIVVSLDHQDAQAKEITIPLTLEGRVLIYGERAVANATTQFFDR